MPVPVQGLEELSVEEAKLRNLVLAGFVRRSCYFGLGVLSSNAMLGVEVI